MSDNTSSPSTGTSRRPVRSTRTQNGAARSSARAVARVKKGGTSKRGESGEQSEDEEPRPPPKKARKSKGKKKVKIQPQGASPLLSFPTDLLYETCNYLDPPTLLSLSQTCKTLNQYLTSKASKPVWSVARRAVGLPKLRTGIPEFFYAFLVFGKGCQLCASRKESEFEHNLQVRLCLPCLKKNLVLESEAQEMALEEGAPLHAWTFDCLPSTPYSANGNQRRDDLVYYYLPDVALMSEALQNLEEKDLKKEDAQAEDEGMIAEPTEPTNDVSLSSFIVDKSAHALKFVKDAKTVFAWQSNLLDEDLAAEKALGEKYFEEIKAKVVSLGYLAQDFDSCYISPHTREMLSQPKRSTDWEWTTKIWPALRGSVEATKAARLQRELAERQQQRREAIRPFYQQLMSTQSRFKDDVLPNLPSLFNMPSMKLFWESDTAVLDSASWNTALPAILNDMATALKIIKYRCYHVIVSHPLPWWSDVNLDDVPPEETMDRVLDLATSIISSVGRSGCTLPYPQYVKYCRNDTAKYHPRRDSVDWSKTVSTFLDSAGMDRSTTHEQLRALGAVFGCGRDTCQASSDLTWDEVISHASSSIHSSGQYLRTNRVHYHPPTRMVITIEASAQKDGKVDVSAKGG